MPSSDWARFWAAPHRAWAANERTRVENEETARAVLHLARLDRGDRVIDFGCGHALGTGLYRDRGVEVVLVDQSPHYRASASQRWDTAVHDLASIADLEPASAQGFTAFSVAQYLTEAEFAALLALARDKLKAGGALVLGDVIPPGTGLREDLRDFLPRTITPRTLAERLWSTATLLASPYRAIRARHALATFTDEAMTSLLQAHGFSAQRIPNIGPNEARVTWVARKR
ncbi:MAG: class I SAM-dependent methyltransferase [Proteobacteria bacterium]|nr:class I SAM-dependent methyltransferase [Pseudomonadota bacterium]